MVNVVSSTMYICRSSSDSTASIRSGFRRRYSESSGSDTVCACILLHSVIVARSPTLYSTCSSVEYYHPFIHSYCIVSHARAYTVPLPLAVFVYSRVALPDS